MSILDSLDIQIGQRLRIVRDLYNENQPDLAKILGCTSSTVSKYERGALALSPLAINQICDHYNVRHGWLLTGDGPIKNHDGKTPDLLANIAKLPPEAITALNAFLQSIGIK
ncbi:XRE family transcriptional regulator [Vibrio parahaemolyticus]|nr:XRE family transcriptional regulator [Vibrio parahaemolyticus]